MSDTDPLDPFRAEAREMASLLGVTASNAEIEAYAHALRRSRAEQADKQDARPSRARTAIPAWLSHAPFTDPHGNPFGRRYFTADGYQARPGLGRHARGARPNRWYLTGPGGYESVVATVAEIITSIEDARARV